MIRTRFFISLLLFLRIFSASSQILISGNFKWCDENNIPANISVSLITADSVVQTTMTDSTGTFFFFTAKAVAQPSFAFSYYGQKLGYNNSTCDTIKFPDYTQLVFKTFCSSLSAKTIDSLQSAKKTDRCGSATHYGNGSIYMVGNYTNGLRIGQWFSFYQNGNLWSVGNYDASGLREGYALVLYSNGEKSSEGYYQKGKAIGKWVYWDNDRNKKEVNLRGE